MSELYKLQVEFVRLQARLIDEAFALGYELTEGDAFRDPRVFGPVGVSMGYGNKSSAHKQRLAKDYNLFKDGKFLDSTEDHRTLGEWWEKQHPLARWGGRFEDGNHYSFEYKGIK